MVHRPEHLKFSYRAMILYVLSFYIISMNKYTEEIEAQILKTYLMLPRILLVQAKSHGSWLENLYYFFKTTFTKLCS